MVSERKFEEAIHFMQLNILFYLSERWNKPMSEITEIDVKYDLLSFIRFGYESFHLTGNKGIALEIEDYIHGCGGAV